MQPGSIFSEHQLIVDIVEPQSEFIAHLGKMRHFAEPEMLVQTAARIVAACYARYERVRPSLPALIDKPAEQCTPQTLPLTPAAHIYGDFPRMRVYLIGLPRMGVAIT